MLFIWFLLLAVAAAVVHWLVYNLTRKIPGRWGYPLVFNLLEFQEGRQRGDLLSVYSGYLSQFGRVFQYRVPGMGIVVESSVPEDQAFMLSDAFTTFEKPPAFVQLMGTMLGDGIFVTNGDKWVEQRKHGVRAFRKKDIRGSVEMIKQEMLKAIDVLAANAGNPIDVSKLMASVTLAAFTRMALSTDKFVSVSLKETEFAFHFNRAVRNTSNRFQTPWFKLTPWSANERELRESIAFIDSSVRQVIDEAKRRDPRDNHDDMLANFMQIPNMTDGYLRDILVNFMLAGRDTTSISLAAFAYHMAANQDVQEKLWAEVAGTLRDGELPDLDKHLDGKLVYLNAVIKEVLRLSPPVPVDMKYAVEDTVLPSGHEIKKGWWVEWCQWNSSRSVENFGPDSFKFRPERWIEDKSLPTTNKPPFIPFQFGPRVCLGMNMALVNLECAIMMLVVRFKFFPTESKPVFDAMLTLVTDRVELIVQERNKQQ